ncbi:hypothetical protein [Bradyrhizobium sp. RT10b]|uniref:hypothetical protein n=1 Tax=Bradyrhizobium sp. RT10b TaxID=3156331 RepID=UPI00339A8268
MADPKIETADSVAKKVTAAGQPVLDFNATANLKPPPQAPYVPYAPQLNAPLPARPNPRPKLMR